MEEQQKKRPGPKPQFDVSNTTWLSNKQDALLKRVKRINRLPSKSAALRFLLDEYLEHGR